MEKTLVVSTGDPSGIGLDLCIKMANESYFYNKLLKEKIQIILLCDISELENRANLLKIKISIKQIVDLKKISLTTKSNNEIFAYHIPVAQKVEATKPSSKNATYIINQLKTAVKLCIDGKAQAMITAPLSKEILQQGGYKDFLGHTEWLANYCTKQLQPSKPYIPVMTFANQKLKAILATTHLPISEISENITFDKLEKIIKIACKDLQKLWGIKSPKLMLLGLNPHAGENGKIGKEEQEILLPLANSLRKQNIDITDPIPADSFFLHPSYKNTDLIIAMYHDQILPLIKYNFFDSTTNITLGLPIIRTSVDHGTAFELAGSGNINTTNLQTAINQAIEFIS
jgi:4-hydroxythreonine-4-phosphate dehydrogenase